MSRVIENDHYWDESEIQYHLDRGRADAVKQNRADFPKPLPEKIVETPVEVQLSQGVFDYVKGLDDETLKSNLKQAGLQTTGEAKELKVRLAQHLQEEENKKSE